MIPLARLIAVWLLAAGIINYLLRWKSPSRFQRAVIAAFLLSLFAIPIALGPTMLLGRFLAAVHSAVLVLKAISLITRPTGRGLVTTTPRILIFLLAWPALDPERALLPLEGSRWLEVRRNFLLCAVYLAGGCMIFLGHRAWHLSPWQQVVATVAVLLEILTFASAANCAIVGGFAIAGFRIEDLFRYPIAARSVLDFWGRYDVLIHRWLKRHVFQPVSGRRRPAAGILAAFAVSGLLHEYLFVVAAPELIGRQFAFFMLHGLGAVIGGWLGQFVRTRVHQPVRTLMGRAATMAFIIATGPIFLSCAPPLLGYPLL